MFDKRIRYYCYYKLRTSKPHFTAKDQAGITNREFSRSYYLLVGLTPEGFLIVQEDREGAVFSTIVQRKIFLNGARHSVYYRRDANVSSLLVDRELIPMIQIPAQSFTNVPELGANEVQIGGHNTTDPRFAIYKGYSGCLSSTFIQNNLR